MKFKPSNAAAVSLAAGVIFIAILAPRPAASKGHENIYHQHNLISDIPGEGSRRDPNLVNPWGIAFSATGPFWVADNHTGVSTVYDAKGKGFPAGNPLVVTIPPPTLGTPPAAPTGIVFNGTNDFLVGTNAPARFIFATEDGTISGWNPSASPNAILKVDNSAAGAIYKGLALGANATGNILYATNFHNGTVDMFNSTFGPVGSFTDVTVPLGFAPFGIRNLGGQLYVTFAKQDAAKEDDAAGPGNGFVDIFNTSGVMVKRLISNGVLNSPWGIEMAPANFGGLSNTLLIGNFGDGTIHGFNPGTGALVGQALIPSSRPLVIEGLWALIFGNGGDGGDPGVLYFTAGIPGRGGHLEDHGQFGEIRPQ